MNKEIDVIIVNWNSGDYLHSCLNSLDKYASGFINKIIVIDNASTDHSANNIYCENVNLNVIINEHNYGFGKACNIGANYAESKYILFLNPDTIVNRNSLKCPLNILESKSEIGICGVKMLDEFNHTSRHCARFPTYKTFISQSLGIDKLKMFRSFGMHMNEWDHESSRNVDHVIGAFFFMRRHLFTDLQGFDEDYFVYYEDIDFSYRAKKKGWLSYYDADCNVIHAGGGSSRKIKAKRLAYSLSGRVIYAKKHYGKFELFLLLINNLFIEPIARSVYVIISGKPIELRNILNGYRLYLQALPKLLKKKYKPKY